jgi:hypothetical protein
MGVKTKWLRGEMSTTSYSSVSTTLARLWAPHPLPSTSTTGFFVGCSLSRLLLPAPNVALCERACWRACGTWAWAAVEPQLLVGFYAVTLALVTNCEEANGVTTLMLLA